MSQIFHRSTNTISRVTIFGALFIVIALLWLLAAVNRSPWVTQAHVAREQPIQFSHERTSPATASTAATAIRRWRIRRLQAFRRRRPA
jgi:hypothetical protein